MEKLISRKEAAKLLGISIATLDAARNSGLSVVWKDKVFNNDEGSQKKLIAFVE